jgi:hypothetical protein
MGEKLVKSTPEAILSLIRLGHSLHPHYNQVESISTIEIDI